MAARVRLHTSRWWGRFAVEFTLAGLYARCEPLAERLAATSRSCLLAYDTRFMSQIFARELRRMLVARGVTAPIAALPSTQPIIHHALTTGLADCALCVSAGNLPYWYNGLTLVSRHADMVLPERGATGPPIPDDFAPPLEEGDPAIIDLRTPYLEMLRAQIEVDVIRRATMTIFVDAMNGAAAGYLPAVIGEGQTKAIEINREPDPLLGKLVPHPAENGLARLRKLVRESDSHVGVAIAADGTALGVVDSTGGVVDGARLLVLLSNYLQREQRLRGTIIAPAQDKATIGPYEQPLGLRVEYAADAEAAIDTALHHDRSGVLAGRTASSCFYVGRPTPSADALLAALLVIEMIARSGGRLSALINEIDDRIA